MNIRFAIIGCGHIAQRHARHIQNNPLATLAGCFDINTGRAKKFAETHVIPVFPTLEKLLADPSIDVINVCTPNGTHASIAIEAMKAGKHVLVEKPMAISMDAAADMVQTAKQTEQMLFVVKQNRYNPPVAKVKKLLDSGVLGAVRMVSVNCFWNRNETYYRQSGWRGTRQLDGGTLFTQFSHFVDILYYLFGDIYEISGMISNVCHGDMIEIEDSGSFSFRFENGALGNLAYTTCAFQKNMEGSITVFSEKGTIKIGGKYLNTIDYYNIEGVEKLDVPKSSPANNYGFYEGSMSNHDKVINNVVETLNGREQIMTTGEEGFQVVKMIESLYHAAINPGPPE